MHSSLKAAFICAALTAPTLVSAITLSEFYRLGNTERAWYLGGVYDTSLIDYRKDGGRSQCLEHMGPEGFTKALSAFVQALPTDPTAPERRTYDSMNVALIAALVVDKACKPG